MSRPRPQDLRLGWTRMSLCQAIVFSSPSSRSTVGRQPIIFVALLISRALLKGPSGLLVSKNTFEGLNPLILRIVLATSFILYLLSHPRLIGVPSSTFSH